MIQTNLRRVLSFLFGSLAFFYGLWQFRRAHSRTGLQNEKNGDEKVMKVNLFYGCGGCCFLSSAFSSLNTLFSTQPS